MPQRVSKIENRFENLKLFRKRQTRLGEIFLNKVPVVRTCELCFTFKKIIMKPHNVGCHLKKVYSKFHSLIFSSHLIKLVQVRRTDKGDFFRSFKAEFFF